MAETNGNIRKMHRPNNTNTNGSDGASSQPTSTGMRSPPPPKQPLSSLQRFYNNNIRHNLWGIIVGVFFIVMGFKKMYKQQVSNIIPGDSSGPYTVHTVKVSYDIYDLYDKGGSDPVPDPPYHRSNLIHRTSHAIQVPDDDKLYNVLAFLQDKYNPVDETRYHSDFELIFVLVKPSYGIFDTFLDIGKAITGNKKPSTTGSSDEKEIYLKNTLKRGEVYRNDDRIAAFAASSGSFDETLSVHYVFGGGGPHEYTLRVIKVPCRGRPCAESW